MTDNSGIQQQTLLLIKEKLLKEKIEDAVSEIQNLIKNLESINDIIENIQRLGYILIIAGIENHNIHSLLKSSSKIILQQKGIDTLFKYWIQFQEQDSELYRYIVDISDEELSDYAQKIDTQASFNRNIAWFLKYNKKFLKDLFEHSDYKLENLTNSVNSTFKTPHALYYKINQRWRTINVEATASKDTATIIYFIQDPPHMAQIVYQHNTNVMPSEVFKFDRYIIIDSDTISILLQILYFSQLDKGNFWFHFLLDTRWKKRLKQFGEIGYTLPNKGIATQDKLQNLLIFINELDNYYDNYLIQVSRTELRKIYSFQYLKRLKKRYQNDISGMHILIMTSRHSTYVQYASETLDKGFKNIGCKSVLLRERKHQGSGFKLEFILRIIKKFKPNMIIAINNFRPDWARELLPEIPWVTWVHDVPRTLPRPCLKKDDNDFIFGAGKSHTKSLQETFPVLEKYDIPFLPWIKYINTDFPIIKNKKYDVGCITHISVSPEILSYYEPEKRIGSNMEKIIHWLLNQMEALEPFEITTIMASKDKSLAIVQKGLRVLNIQIEPKIDNESQLVTHTFHFEICYFLQKTLSVRYLINNGFKNIFIGGLGWDQLEFFRPYAVGQISHKDLPSAIGNIAINLNPTAESTFHPRIGEMLEANSFVISSWKGEADTAPLTDYFLEDEEVVLFKTYKDLAKKVEYFLKHPEKREAITKKAKQKFIQHFSAEMGCRKILDHVLGINSIE